MASPGKSVDRKGTDVSAHLSDPAGPFRDGGAVGPEGLQERLDEYKAIARNVSLDAGLDVSLGQPGKGSYCAYGGPSGVRVDRVSRRIVIDPLHMLEESNKFVIAHEGMHAYVTRSPFDASVYHHLKKACDPDALYEELGFASLLNYLEDCGGNDWLTASYPAFEQEEQQLYDSMLRAENPEMHTGETKAVMARLGFFPRFAQFGSEVMKRWHTGELSAKLDPSVEAALAKQLSNVDRFIASFPKGQLSSAQERDALFCKRFLVAALQVMPSVRALVGEDKAQAALQQFANEQSKQGQEGGQPQPDQDCEQPGQGGGQPQPGQPGGQPQPAQGGGQPQPGQPGGQPQPAQGDGQPQPGQPGGQPQPAQGDGQPQPGQQSSPDTDASGGGSGSSPLSPETQREINEKSAAHREGLRRELQEQLDELSKHLGGSGSEGTEEPTAEEQAKQIEELQKSINEKFDGPDDADAKREVEKHLDALKKLHESIDSQAAPLDQLSQEAKDELKERYDELEAEQQRRLEDLGEKLLKEFEDAIREQLEGKTAERPAPTHEEQRRAKEDSAKAAKVHKKMQEDVARLEELRRSKRSLWDSALEDVSGLVQRLYSRLERILRPTVPEWDSGHSSGSRINPLAAMQAKADPKLKSKMWEQKSLPVEREFVFTLLVDNSGSMRDSEKYLHARRCAVLLSEVLTRLKIPFEISTFAEGSAVLKEFDKKPSEERKNEIGGAINGGGNSTNDHSAIETCLAALSKRSEEHRFLIVITDGGSDNPTMLQKVLAQALARNIRVIGLGIGEGTGDVDKYYPIGRGGLLVDSNHKDLGLRRYFADLLEKILKNPQQVVADARKGNHGGKQSDE